MLIPFVCFVFSGICDGKLYNNLGAIAWGTGYGKTVGWPIDHFNAVLNIFQSYFGKAVLIVSGGNIHDVSQYVFGDPA